MDGLLERIEENKLDALYLFINETLRDRTEFDRFFQNLCSVLPHNWSIQRVEVGHEFLSMCHRNQQEQEQQEELFPLICGLESLRALIVSDGYIPRKDNGTIDTDSFLTHLPQARNLQFLDVQRLKLHTPEQVDLLASVFECMQDSLEEIRITSISLKDGLSLDPAIQVCVEMEHLRSLAVSCVSPKEVQQQQQAQQQATGTNATTTNVTTTTTTTPQPHIISQEVLLELCQSSTTLQDLALRAMRLDDETCQTIAEALITNSFLTSLDIRQNPSIGNVGYKAILGSLERNYDLWCSVMVDNDSFQAKFNALIELNQANRGDLVRSPTREKLATFLERLNGTGEDPTSLWYFLTIHDSILHPLVGFLKWKSERERRQVQAEEQERQQLQEQREEEEMEPKKRAAVIQEEQLDDGGNKRLKTVTTISTTSSS